MPFQKLRESGRDVVGLNSITQRIGIYRREVIDIFLNFVYLDDDRIVIGINYKSGTKAVNAYLDLHELGKCAF